MYQIEAKIRKSGNSRELVITCPCRRTCPCIELTKLMVRFPTKIDISNGVSNDGYPVLLMVHEPEELLKHGSNDRDIDQLGQDFFNKKNVTLMPEIHFSKEVRYMPSLYSKKKLVKDLRREYEIMDNSIWNFLVPMDDIQEDAQQDKMPKKEELLNDALEAIYKNYELGLYKLRVTIEFADWNARLFHESYLVEGGTHALDVSPYVFHSESAIRLSRKKEFPDEEILLKFKGDDVKWRFLIVDDYAAKDLELVQSSHQVDNAELLDRMETELKDQSINYSQSDNSPEITVDPVTKCNIVKILLERHGFRVHSRSWHDDEEIEEGASDIDILIEYAETFEDAQRAFKRKKYDIILLDYLLDGNKDKNIRHYGYELLEDIKDKKNEYKIGPNGHLFFIFMSAFTSAVEGRLLAQGLSRSEDYWYIDTGACPTNTPQLFTYNLLQLMDKRLDDSGIQKLSVNKILKVIKEIFFPRDMVADKSSVRERASEHYQDVLSLQYYYRKMLKDVEIPQGYKQGDHLFNINGSVLISHFMLENQHLDGLLEHLTELVHLTAFGTIRQWAEMWEEYLYIRAKLEEIDDGRQDFKAVCDYIEEYILNLKAQQR